MGSLSSFLYDLDYYVVWAENYWEKEQTEHEEWSEGGICLDLGLEVGVHHYYCHNEDCDDVVDDGSSLSVFVGLSFDEYDKLYG